MQYIILMKGGKIMKTDMDCILCYERAAMFLAKRFALPQEQNEAMIREILRTIAESDYRDSPPVNARKLYEVIFKYSHVEDPFQPEKDRSTACALQLLPILKEELAGFHDYFEGVVRLAMAGNIIDYGVNSGFDLNTAHDEIKRSFKEEISLSELEIFRRKLESAKKILYITDNCGEVVFDTLLMEPYHDKITVAVRGKPILNDATRREAEESGLVRASARLIDTGDNTPGVDLRRSSAEFLDAYHSADLIISKGQGNFETLCEEKRPIVFLLRAKCPVVVSYAKNVKLGNCLIRHVNFEC